MVISESKPLTSILPDSPLLPVVLVGAQVNPLAEFGHDYLTSISRENELPTIYLRARRKGADAERKI